MAKKSIEVSDTGVIASRIPEDARLEHWKKWLENYATKQPVRYAEQMANHEFDKIPDSFKGNERI